MVHRHVETIGGRLVTDEASRARFAGDARLVLAELGEAGLELTPAEADALAATPPSTWTRMAAALDPRLQKIDLKEPRRGLR